MRDKKLILVMVVMVTCLFALTGCGKKKIDVMETLTLNYSGADGYGKAEIENAYGWEAEALEEAGIKKIEDFSSLGGALTIEMSVSYDVYPNENLSNGDEVIVTATVNNEAVEEYDIEFVAKEKKFIVEGLPEIIQVDLFENIDVDFQGIAPNVTASVTDANSDCYVFTRYSIDKSRNLNVGDIVTVMAEYDKDEMLEKGYIAESDTKQYEVKEVSKYVSELDEISEDAMEQLKKQTEDIIKADVAEHANRARALNEKRVYTLEDMAFLGNYFLKAKNMESAYRKNYYYFVYKLDMAGENPFSCYFTVAYLDLIRLEDGTCSYDFDNRIVSNPSISVSGLISYSGYEDLDKLYNQCVTQNLANYTYESNVIEQ